MVGLMIGGRVSIFFFLVDAWQGKARMPLMEKREREGTSGFGWISIHFNSRQIFDQTSATELMTVGLLK